MSARALRALACLGLGSGALGGGRRHADEEVQASQHGFSLAWREHYNKGETSFCGKAYLPDASLHLDLGPAAAEMQRVLGLKDPVVLHGSTDIAAFWNRSFAEAGLRTLSAYEESGEYASTAFVLDDDTVIVKGKFSLNKAISGQIFSELWVRSGEEWKLRSQMLAIQNMEAGLKLGTAAAAPKAEPKKSVVGSAVSSLVKLAEKELGAKAPEKAKELLKPALPELSKKARPASEKAFLKASAMAGGSPVAAGATGAKASGGHSMATMFCLALLTVGVAAFLLRRSKRRSEAAIARFDAMLG